MKASKIKSGKRAGGMIKILSSIVLAIVLFAAIAWVWGVDLNKDIALLLVGGIIAMGLATLFAAALDNDKSNWIVLFRTTVLAGIVSVSFFTLESGSSYLLASQLPISDGMRLPEIILVVLWMMALGVTVIVQMAAPALPSKPFYRALAIHLRNGFYTNAIFDRMIGALRVQGKKKYYV